MRTSTFVFVRQPAWKIISWALKERDQNIYHARVFYWKMIVWLGVFYMSMRDRWTSDLHGGSPKGLPSSKFACLNYFVRWFWRMCSWFNKMSTLGSRGYFFLIDTDGSRRSRSNEARSAEEKELLISTREHVYFILGILRTDLWNQGTKCVVCQKRKKKI